jgi:hypothetical protein
MEVLQWCKELELNESQQHKVIRYIGYLETIINDQRDKLMTINRISTEKRINE